MYCNVYVKLCLRSITHPTASHAEQYGITPPFRKINTVFSSCQLHYLPAVSPTAEEPRYKFFFLHRCSLGDRSSAMTLRHWAFGTRRFVSTYCTYYPLSQRPVPVQAHNGQDLECQSWSGKCGGNNKSLPVPVVEPRCPGRPFRSQVTTLTTPSRRLCPEW